MLTEKYKLLHQKLIAHIEADRMFYDPLYTLAFGSDASFYRLVPKLVVKAKNEQEISLILRETSRLGIPVTFRAAGTSLSGQAISDSVLIIAGEHWKQYEILEEGKKIQLQPGLTGAKVNSLLAPFQRKIGPDPASINAAMIGGIAANNASGMCCGTVNNSYQTVAGMQIIFYDGSVLNTRDEKSKLEFQKSHPAIISEIKRFVKAVKANEELVKRIRKKFSIKNTTGYSLNALVDFTDPFDIIEHLIIGSEGTLGFISEITYHTIEELPYKACSMMIFPDIEKACAAVVLLKSEAVSTAELIDRAGLKTAENEAGMPEWITRLSDRATALLVETRAANKETLNTHINQIKKAIQSIQVEIPVNFTDVPSEYILYWKIRKGLFPSVGAARKTGTTVIIEDVAFPLHRLAEATLDLQSLFKKHHYDEAVIFGHALDGNLHFVFTQDFSIQTEITRYGHFMDDVADLVVKKYDGSLKAEHGTGRNIAPFVELEWGKDAYELMRQIKNIFDPYSLLNPGVILNADEKAHLKNLKLLPAANKNVDKCTECGFCEPACVSTELTLSPRQRITVLREICQLNATGAHPHLAASLVNQYDYSGNETCATDGLCALACPVKIDTGKMIKDLRKENLSMRKQKIAMWIAGHINLVSSIIRNVLSFISFAHNLLGTNTMIKITKTIRVFSGDQIPKWTPEMPLGARKIKIEPDLTKNPNKVVYFPSCINRTMGNSNVERKESQLTETVQKLIRKAGFEVIFPKEIDKLCCGMAFSSKGYKEAGLKKSKELETALLLASEHGKYPILCDMSPCLFTMKENMGPNLKLYEPVEFILEYLIPKLKIVPINETISVFPVCSTTKMGLDDKLIQLAKLCATKVFVPETNCCGFAGDRGFSFPELNAHGLRYLKDQTPEKVTSGYSTSRTCEIGLSTHSGVPFKSIVYLVDKVSNTN